MASLSGNCTDYLVQDHFALDALAIPECGAAYSMALTLDFLTIVDDKIRLSSHD